LKEINPRRSASKAPKSKPKKRNSKGKWVSSISNEDDSQTKDATKKNKRKKKKEKKAISAKT